MKMTKLQITSGLGIAFLIFGSISNACEQCEDLKGPDTKIESTSAKYNAALDSIVLEIKVEGLAGKTQPVPVGKLDGAPVLGYVFPTTLKSTDVGFSETEGIVALALTSHPDFDDTPLWDENLDGVYDNDGLVWHSHWVILVKDDRVKGGLSVKPFDKEDKSMKLPPTAPGMPMFMDSPGFQVVTDGNTIRVLVPAVSVNRNIDFKFDAVTCFMKVNTSDKKLPMLGVYKVYGVASGDLTLPYSVKK
ncbi:MAG: hypothetical protein L3J39_01665 [Verrucomicrobiales bacterium]|nr:hypothetical protein [Verrucomicrobiales bacterium]